MSQDSEIALGLSGQAAQECLAERGAGSWQLGLM